MNELTEAKTTAVALDEELLKMGGAGLEHVKAKDILIPRVTLLQKLSPQINKKKSEFIEGADLGDFCNVATGDVFKEQIEVIPVHFITQYIEWGKNRSGFVNNYGDDEAILKQTVRNEKNQNILPNGNSIAETSQWYCLLRDGASWSRIFIPLTSTNLKVSRKWMTLIKTEIIQTANGPWKPPLFWRSWKLTAIEDSNEQGDWFTFKPERGPTTLELDQSKELLRMCMAFYNDVKTNVVRGEILQEDEGKPTSVGDPSDKEIPF
jgi:hypothetical protein